MKWGLAALALAENRCRIRKLTTSDLSKALEHAGVAVTPLQLERAFARAAGRVSRNQAGTDVLYSVMTTGRAEVDATIGRGKLGVVYIDGERPRTARRELHEILGELQGTIRICDPYFGVRTLDALEMIRDDREVRFLTAHISGDAARVQGPLQDFRKERPKTELRRHDGPSELHDRYVLSDSMLLLVGHGLKDIGGKESFVVAVPRSLASDLLEEVRGGFDRRWGTSKPL